MVRHDLEPVDVAWPNFLNELFGHSALSTNYCSAMPTTRKGNFLLLSEIKCINAVALLLLQSQQLKEPRIAYRATWRHFVQKSVMCLTPD